MKDDMHDSYHAYHEGANNLAPRCTNCIREKNNEEVVLKITIKGF